MFQRSVAIEHFDGDTLNVIHHEGVEINVFHYLNGTSTNLAVEDEPYFDDMVKSSISALSDGFYIISSSGATRVHKKGGLPRNVFIKSNEEDHPHEITIYRYAPDGTLLGELEAFHLTGNMYSAILPNDNLEILKVGDLYVVCDVTAECSVYNIDNDFPKSNLIDNSLKADIIPYSLSSRVKTEKPKFSLRKTTFRIE